MVGDKIKILWADDEIDLLKPQLFFLEKKGYEVVTVSNGHDALDILDEDSTIDIVFLDESMPGLTGLETLSRIKDKLPNIPIVMITKNEAENIMEEAIGSQIDDYLIKPVNPNQILLTLKKIVDNKRLISEKTATDYQQEFRNISMEINSGPDYTEWVNIYKKIISWELRLDDSNNQQMKEILNMQKEEANKEFFKYVSKNYLEWFKKSSGPRKSQDLMKEKVFPLFANDKPTIMILMDNLRYDQWKIIEPIVTELYRIEEEDFFYSILPTATQYSRNAIFSGMTPLEIQKKFPDWWLNDNEEGGKNLKEGDLLQEQVKKLVKKEIKTEYVKVTNVQAAKQLQDNALNFFNNDFTAIVYNFIDMLSHSRTEMEVLKELAGDEKAYRSLTKTWFINSPLWAMMQKLAERDIQLVITTDHGTIRVQTSSKVIGDRETTTNLRYKVGRNLQYDRKDVLEVRNPAEAGLPSPNMSSSYIFAKEDVFFLYPNNFTYFNNFFKDTFQHGGISLEEMICPIIRLVPKR
ncbi:MAG TPA: bifunctional response regulator/alkaline phosphatase family protein [Saprospiraceae bacterium]|jgi:CheY-like chemotaxis protein|nr:bifunctional response regulator/alkaline phosphatase family protein [Saprospiraceae bacterium]